MFVKNNERLSFPILEERLSLETLNVQRSLVRSDHLAVSAGVPSQNGSFGLHISSEAAMKFEKKRRSLPKKIGAGLSRFFKLYRLGDEAEYSVRLAAETARRVGDLEDRLQRFEKQLDERVGGIERRGSDRHAALEHSLDDRSSALEHRSSALEQSWRAQFADAERSVSERLAALERGPLAALGNEVARALEERGREQDHLRRELQQTLLRVDALRREIMFQQRRVTQLALPASAEERVRAAARVVDERLDSFYVANRLLTDLP